MSAFDLTLDLRTSAETIQRARQVADTPVQWNDTGSMAEKLGRLQATCESLTEQLERAHAALGAAA